jgi:hypothetical protein
VIGRATLEERLLRVEERLKALEPALGGTFEVADATAKAHAAQFRLQRTLRNITRASQLGMAVGVLAAGAGILWG